MVRKIYHRIAPAHIAEFIDHLPRFMRTPMTFHQALPKISTAIAAVMCWLIAAPPALADPPAGRIRAIVAVGSETTQAVMDEIANTYFNETAVTQAFRLASYWGVARGGADNKILTRNPLSPNISAPCFMTRPVNSLAAVNALVHFLNIDGRPELAEDCVHVARTDYMPVKGEETNDGSLTTNPLLVYYPFANDAVTFVVRADNSIALRLTAADLRTIYSCRGPPTLKPLLPYYGSGLRRAFLKTIGYADTPGFAGAGGFASCVGEVSSHAQGIFLAEGNIMPHSIANYIAQANRTEPDARGRAILGVIDEREPLMPYSANSVSYAFRSTSAVPVDLSIGELRQIYTCATGTSALKPLLPPWVSSLRHRFLVDKLGLANTQNFTQTYPCVKEVAADGSPIQENWGIQLTIDEQLMPYDVDKYLGQIFNRLPDQHGRSALGAIGGISAFKINDALSFLDQKFVVFNAVPYSRIQNNDYPYVWMFDGPGSAVCSRADVIRKHGFQTTTACGARQFN